MTKPPCADCVNLRNGLRKVIALLRQESYTVGYSYLEVAIETAERLLRQKEPA